MELDVRRLRVLREVALRGTVAAAAEGRGFAPSAISQQLTALERERGSVVFVLADLDLVVGHEDDHARLEATPDVVRVDRFAEEMLVAAPNGRFSAPVPSADLATSNWAAEPPDSSCGQAVRDACRSAGFQPDVR